MDRHLDPTSTPGDDVVAQIGRLVGDARALWRKHQLAASEPLLRRALELAEGSLGPDDVNVAAVLCHLGHLATARGEYGDAVARYGRALTILEGRLGRSDPNTLRAMEELAGALFHTRAYQAAEEMALCAIAGYEAAGVENGDLARLVATVAWRRYWAGRYAEAEPLFLRALAMRRRRLGPRDPATADTARWLAILYDRPASSVDPEPYYRESLAGYEQAYDSDHPAVLEARYRLADYLHRHDRDEEASPMFERLATALGTDDSAFDPGTAGWMLDGCSRYLRDIGREADAKALDRRPRHKRFDCFTFPWRDGRRPELIRTYLAAMAERDKDDPTGAVMAITALTFQADPDEQWAVILQLLAEAPGDDSVLQAIAAGPLEGFLGRFGETVIDRVEAEASRDPGFRRLLSGVWKNSMSDATWQKVRAIQATVSNPLPEMRPFPANEPTPRTNEER